MKGTEMIESNKFEEWWEAHPFFKKFYVPMVLTATFVVTVADWIGL